MADFDPSTPSIARVYDYLLNGKDNFAVDREVAQKLLAVVPISADVMRENRQFLARATRWAAGHGVTQFIDLGCGMPTEPNTHGSARTAVPEPTSSTRRGAGSRLSARSATRSETSRCHCPSAPDS